MLTTVREAVDNSLDACEEAGILPEIHVEISHVAARKEGQQLLIEGGNGKKQRGFGGADRLIVSVQDNGPGIVKEQIPKIFGKLLYGSKFHRLRMSRGQQGIGICAAAMYGAAHDRAASAASRRASGRAKPRTVPRSASTPRRTRPRSADVEIDGEEEAAHGTKVAIEIEGALPEGHGQSVDEYLKQTAVANPHARIVFKDPDGETSRRTSARRRSCRRPPKEIKPHPYGVELGVLINMMRDTRSRTVKGFLQDGLLPRQLGQGGGDLRARGRRDGDHPKTIARDEADRVYEGDPADARSWRRRPTASRRSARSSSWRA